MTLLTKRKAESDPVDFEDEMTNGNMHHEIHLGNLTNEDTSSSLLLTDPVQNHAVNMNHMDHAAMASELNSHTVRKDVEDHDDDDDVDVDDDHDLVVDDEDTKAAVEAVMGEMDVSDVGCSGAKKRAAVGGDANWNAMLFQLIFYKAVHGDLRPKSKDEEHKPLYDWMVGQRKEFKVYQETPEKSYLTPDQVKVLDFLQFPWNTRGDEHWIRNLEHLQQFRREHGHCMVPRTFLEVPNLCHWVTDQRRQLKNLKAGKPSTMTKERQRVLDEMGFVWQVRNRTTWDIRFAELVEYKEKKGTTVVPQRKLYSLVLRKAGVFAIHLRLY
jgi:Helicase associated domain